MAAFHYRAVNEFGQSVKGVMSARNEAELAHLIGEMELELISCHEKQLSLLQRLWGGRIDGKELIRFVNFLEKMTNAGVPLFDALGDARDSVQDPILRNCLNAIYRDVGDGFNLSEALEKHPKYFGFVTITLIAVGERSGRMDEALGRLRVYLEWSQTMLQRTRKALRYPAFAAFMLVAVTAFMMLAVVPQVVEFLKSNGQALPIQTEALIATSNAFTHYWWAIFGLPAAAICLILVLRKSSPGMLAKSDAFLLRLPIAGPVIKALSLARYVQVTAIMYNAGVPIIHAIKTALPSVGNQALSDRLGYVAERIETGVALSKALQQTGEFEQPLIRQLQLGETTGELADALARIADDLNSQADERIQDTIAKIEPSLTLILGGLMAWIALAVFGPIYDSISQIDIL